MEYARLGNAGLMVSALCLGCMTFGQEADEETSKEIVGRFLDAGGNFVDTTDVYSKGVSEEITGRSLRGVRDDVVLATKVRFPMGEGPNDVGLSRKLGILPSECLRSPFQTVSTRSSETYPAC